jgi:hypothetical protein
MKAWIIKWNWVGEHAAVDEAYVGVLSARLSSEQVRRYVEMLYSLKSYSLSEQLEMSRYNKPRENPYRAHHPTNWHGNIVCGHNPYLEAFLAEQVVVQVSSENKESLSYNRLRRPQD